MIKEALEYLVNELAPANIRDIQLENGKTGTFSDKSLYRVKPEYPMASAITMSTLSSLLDYIKANIDEMQGKMIIHVVSPTKVRLYSQLVGERQREYMVDVVADLPKFPFDEFVANERFIIGVQSKFMDDPEGNKDLVLKFAGTVESGTIAQYSDDGVSQKATVKKGITSTEQALVPSPISLRPFRTFVEVEQPVSDFIFRIKEDKYDGIACAIIEADGGAWKNEAMYNIKKYLQNELAVYSDQFTVIS